jgi:hypothetical protein
MQMFTNERDANTPDQILEATAMKRPSEAPADDSWEFLDQPPG